MTTQQKIPVGWQSKTLGDFLSKFEGGGTPSKLNQDYWGGLIPWASVKDVVTHNPNDTQDHITELGLKNSSSRLVPKGTLIVPTRMALGHSVIFDIDVAINQDLKAIYPKTELKNKYLFYWFKSKKEFIKKLGSGSTVSGIQQNDLKSIKFSLPSLPEQNRIVEVLETWDKCLERLNQKIKIKKNIKKGLMQNLLIGKVRTKVFDQEWKTVKLMEVCDFVNGFAFKSDTYISNGAYKIITIANVQDNFMNIKNVCLIDKIPENVSERQILKKDDILISMTGNVGRICRVNEEKCLLNQRVGKIIPKKIKGELLFFILADRRFLNKMIEKAQGGAQDNLSTEDIQKYTFNIPVSLDEQTAISNVLMTADKEIEALKKQREIIKNQKKFLLNNLITGVIRLPEFINKN